MAASSHGSTPAAWTAVVIALVGFTVGGIGMVLGPNWPTFWVGCALIAVSPLVGKVLSTSSSSDRERHAGT